MKHWGSVVQKPVNSNLNSNSYDFKYLSGRHGDFVVHLTNNRMFYGRAFSQHMVEVSINAWYCSGLPTGY